VLRGILAGVPISALLWLATPARADEIVVVLHATNPTQEISLQGLRLLYGGYKRKWRDDRAVSLVLPTADSPAMTYLAVRVFKLADAASVDRYYLEAVYEQRIADLPARMDPRSAIARVRSDPSAIAIVPRAAVESSEGLKLIALRTPQ
jgi:hypothetical protein